MTSRRVGFIVYVSRSGSTLFGDRLSIQPEVTVVPESNFIPRIITYLNTEAVDSKGSYYALYEFLVREKKFEEWGLPLEYCLDQLNKDRPKDWKSIALSILGAYSNYFKPDARIILLKKSGWYARNIETLLRTFSDSICLSIVRDPRAVYSSSKRALHSVHGQPLEASTIRLGIKWRRFCRYIEGAKHRFPTQVFEARYEDLISDPGGTLESCFNFLGVTCPSSEVQEIVGGNGNGRLVGLSTKHLHPNVNGPIEKSRVSSWRRDLGAVDIMLINCLCRGEMIKKGYLDGFRFSASR